MNAVMIRSIIIHGLYNIGRTTSGGISVKRERNALLDLLRGNQGGQVIFTPY